MAQIHSNALMLNLNIQGEEKTSERFAFFTEVHTAGQPNINNGLESVAPGGQ